MSAKDIVLGAASGGAAAAAPTYVDDVFSTYLYTGNGSTQTITNGIDLAGKGGLVWCKYRTHASYDHMLVDTARGVNQCLLSNSTSAQLNNIGSVSSFNSTGFGLGNYGDVNANNAPFVSWTFRKAAKFFDVVTYTGNGVAGRQIAHSLGVAPGMVIVKSLGAPVNAGADGFWFTYHRGLSSPGSGAVFLNNTDGRNSTGAWNNTLPTADVFTIDDGSYTNISGRQHVAYLFAHDTAADGMIQCGSFAGNVGMYINLGWEPQFVLCKRSDGVGDWFMVDIMRNFIAEDNFAGPTNSSAFIRANTAQVEGASGLAIFTNAKGFYPYAFGVTTYIYMAIRRPNKPPTSGTQVFSCSYGLDTTPSVKAFNSPIAVDLLLGKVAFGPCYVQDRLRGAPQYMSTESTGGENTSGDWRMDTMNGVNYISARSDLTTRMGWMFKRAPGFFDVVCYTGVGIPGYRAIPHNLTVSPELIIVKRRSAAAGWVVGSSYFAGGGFAGNNYFLNTDGTTFGSGYLGGGTGSNPTATNFYVEGYGAANDTDAAGVTYVAYLFATCAGVSKVGSYTGNGSSQTINCGFAAGARFILIKRTDAAGDWYVWDTTRGIAAANDPHLSLNTTTAEVTTDDSIDPASTGFIVNQVSATNINVTSATYIFLAIA